MEYADPPLKRFSITEITEGAQETLETKGAIVTATFLSLMSLRSLLSLMSLCPFRLLSDYPTDKSYQFQWLASFFGALLYKFFDGDFIVFNVVLI